MGFPYHAKPLTAGWDKGEPGDASPHSRDTEFGSTDMAAGSGTQVSGYVESAAHANTWSRGSSANKRPCSKTRRCLKVTTA